MRALGKQRLSLGLGQLPKNNSKRAVTKLWKLRSKPWQLSPPVHPRSQRLSERNY